MQKTSNNISFKSDIHFINRETFCNMDAAVELFACSSRDIYVGKRFWTQDVRSCSAGGVVSAFINSVGFHFFHDKKNFLNSSEIATHVLNKIKKPTNALLLGGKSCDEAPYSIKLFQNLKDEFLKSVKNISIFEEHTRNYGQTHICYSRKEDNWWICSEYSRNKSVQDLQELLSVFKNISIAKTDRLFIAGKEITHEQAPHIFVK